MFFTCENFLDSNIFLKQIDIIPFNVTVNMKTDKVSHMNVSISTIAYNMC